ncbi:MAG TPA: immunity 22 family protein [Acidimicrobiales bacterium]|nr:immunity 22 family protein [Acidimicrobiales bacterium]
MVVVEYEVVDVWLGRFADKAAADTYFEETYDDPADDEEQPISPFAADMAETFYDHDFMEWQFHPHGVSDLRTALADHSFSSSYVSSVVSAAAPLTEPDPVNVVLLVWGREIETPISVRTPAMSLVYVGRFACDPNAPEAARP